MPNGVIAEGVYSAAGNESGATTQSSYKAEPKYADDTTKAAVDSIVNTNSAPVTAPVTEKKAGAANLDDLYAGL